MTEHFQKSTLLYISCYINKETGTNLMIGENRSYDHLNKMVNVVWDMSAN